MGTRRDFLTVAGLGTVCGLAGCVKLAAKGATKLGNEGVGIGVRSGVRGGDRLFEDTPTPTPTTTSSLEDMFSDFDDEATPNFVFDRTPTPDFDLHNTPSYWTDIKTAEPEPKLILAMGPRVDTLAPGEYVGFHIMSRQGELSNGRFGEPPRFFALEYDFSVLSGSPIDVYLFELEEWENWAKNRQSYYLSNGSKLNATSGSVSTLVSNQPYALVFYNRSSRTSRVSIDI